MTRVPRSRYGVILGGLLGLTLGPAGVAAGLLCGVLLDSVLSEAKARRAVRACLEEATAKGGAGAHTDRARPSRDRDRLSHRIGGVEWIRLAAVAVRINSPVGVARGQGVPADRIAKITGYLQTVYDLPPRVTARLLPAVHTESLSYSLEQLLENLFRETSGDSLNSHTAFLDSLLPAGRSVDHARLLWDPDASAVLGLNRPASLPEVRAAFRRLAREHHPDQSGCETDAFIRIRGAYETLITRNSVRSEARGCEGARRDPRSPAQSDTHC